MDLDRAKIAAAEMFPGHKVVGVRVIDTHSEVESAVIRLSGPTGARRVLFFGDAAPVEVTKAQRARLVQRLHRGLPAEAALASITAPMSTKEMRVAKTLDEQRLASDPENLDSMAAAMATTVQKSSLFIRLADEYGFPVFKWESDLPLSDMLNALIDDHTLPEVMLLSLSGSRFFFGSQENRQIWISGAQMALMCGGVRG